MGKKNKLRTTLLQFHKCFFMALKTRYITNFAQRHGHIKIHPHKDTFAQNINIIKRTKSHNCSLFTFCCFKQNTTPRLYIVGNSSKKANPYPLTHETKHLNQNPTIFPRKLFCLKAKNKYAAVFSQTLFRSKAHSCKFYSFMRLKNTHPHNTQHTIMQAQQLLSSYVKSNL